MRIRTTVPALLPLALLLCGARPVSSVSVQVVLEGPGLVAAVPRPMRADEARARDVRRARDAELDRQRSTIVPELLARGARVEGDYRRLINAVRISAPPSVVEDVRKLAGVIDVQPVVNLEFQLARVADRVGAPTVWGSGVPGVTGRNVRVAVVDSGVDYLHATFGGSGDPAEHAANDPTIVEPNTFPTAKVTAGVDLVGDDYVVRGTPQPDPDPLECSTGMAPHGTLMASAIGGFGVTSTQATYRGTYDMSFDPAAFSIGPGVAPGVEIYAVKVGGCGQRSTDRWLDGLEWVVDPNQDGDFSDRPDIVNLSMGRPFGVVSSVFAEAIQQLLDMGIVVIAGNGNDRVPSRGYFASSAPGVLRGVISAGSAYNEALIFDRLSVVGADGQTLSVPWQQSSASQQLPNAGRLVGVLRAPQEPTGCESFAQDFSDRIAIIRRGGCPYVQKFRNAAAAGAIAIVIVDNGAQDRPFGMAGAGSVPAGMIRLADGDAILELLSAGDATATLDPEDRYPVLFGPDAMTGISARGPSAVDGSLKPDVVAPANPVLVAYPGMGSGGASLDGGSSIATAFTSGAAALLLGAHPEWTAPTVKAALINTAADVRDLDEHLYPLTLSGAGRIDVAAASSIQVLAYDQNDPELASLSLGGIVADEVTTIERDFEIANLTATARDYTLRPELVNEIAGVAVDVQPRTVTVAAGATGTARLTMSVDPNALPAPVTDRVTNPLVGAAGARHFLVEAGGFVRIEEAGATKASLPFFAAVRAAHRLTPTLEPGCAEDPVSMTFPGADAYPNLPAVVGVFEHIPKVGSGQIDAVGYALADEVLFIAIGASKTFPTPAANIPTVVLLRFDTDQDGTADFDAIVDGIDFSGTNAGNRDLLKVKVVPHATYDSQVDNPFTHLNWVRPDEAYTAPFFNDVWVFPVRLADILVDDPMQPIDVHVHVGRLDPIMDHAFELTPGAASIDATRDGSPFSIGGAPLDIRVDPSRPNANALVVNLTGGDGYRKTIVDVSTREVLGGALELKTTRERTVAEETVAIVVEVTNSGDTAAEDVNIIVDDVATVVGRVVAGETKAVTVEVALPLLGENTTSIALRSRCLLSGPPTEIVTTRVEPTKMLDDDGGCGCRAAAAPQERAHPLALPLAFAAVTLVRRRRANVRKRGSTP